MSGPREVITKLPRPQRVHPVVIADRMMPSLGYFGGVDGDFLSLAVRRSVHSLRLTLAPDTPTYLNLRGVQIRDPHGPIEAGALVASALLSSVRERDRNKDPAGLFALRGIHSDREAHPFWEVTFRRAVDVDTIRIYNRRDPAGRRSYKIDLTAEDAAGSEVVIHRRGGAHTFSQTLEFLRRLLGREFPGGLPGSVAEAESWRRRTVDAVYARLRQGGTELTRWEMLLTFGLLPTTSDAEYAGDDWRLLGYLLLYERILVPGSRTGLSTFAAVLDSPQKLASFQDLFAEAEAVLDLPSHRIVDLGIEEAG